MTRPPELSTAYARLILRSELLPPARALRGTGLTEQSLEREAFLPWQVFATLFDNLERERPGLGWAPVLGALFNINAHGPLGFAALSAPTLGAALEVLASLYPARTNAMRAGVEQVERRYYLWLEDVTADEVFGVRMALVVMRIIESLLEAILGHPVGHNVEVHIKGAAPAADEAIRDAFNSRVLFGAGRSSLSLPATWCALPSPLHDEGTYRANCIRCREIIARRERGGSTTAVVSGRLHNHFDHLIGGDSPPAPPPTLAQIADEMHVTERTLIRRLGDEGSSYRKIMEHQRRELATSLLGRAGLQVAEISELLGYRDPANFGRAFRRWYGCSPARWRRG